MLDVHFVLLGAVISGVGCGAYLRDTVRGETSPNRVTWLLWAAAPLLAFAVELRAGVGLRATLTAMAGIGALAIFLGSFANRSAVWRVTRFDLVCGLLSVLGTVGWLVTRDGLVALVASIAADALAGFPTILKSWRYPETESGGLYRASLASAVITLLTISHVTAAVVAFPAYIFIVSLAQTALVVGRVGPRVRARQTARVMRTG